MTPEEQAAETAQKLEQLTKDLEYQKAEAKKAFEARDNAKKEAEELRKAEADRKQKEAESQGQFKELAEQKAKEAEELKKQLDELSPKAKSLEEQITKIETERREELLSQLDEKHKEFAKDLNLDKLKAYVDLNKDEKVNTATGKGGKTFAFETVGKKYDDFTIEQLKEIESKNPALLKELIKQKTKR